MQTWIIQKLYWKVQSDLKAKLYRSDIEKKKTVSQDYIYCWNEIRIDKDKQELLWWDEYPVTRKDEKKDKGAMTSICLVERVVRSTVYWKKPRGIQAKCLGQSAALSASGGTVQKLCSCIKLFDPFEVCYG